MPNNIISDHITFKSDEEAKKWGLTQNASKYSYINLKVSDDDVILCQTCLVYEDELRNKAYDIMSFLGSLLPDHKRPVEDYDYAYADDASELRDMIIEYFEQTYNVRIVNVFDEF